MTVKTVLIAFALVLSACSTVTVVPGGKAKVSTAPTFEESRPFYLAGLIGEQSIDVAKICPNGVSQVQTQSTFLDSLLGGITLTIYAPRTVKVWCKG